jgi:hypothetical protein
MFCDVDGEINRDSEVGFLDFLGRSLQKCMQRFWCMKIENHCHWPIRSCYSLYIVVRFGVNDYWISSSWCDVHHGEQKQVDNQHCPLYYSIFLAVFLWRRVTKLNSESSISLSLSSLIWLRALLCLGFFGIQSEPGCFPCWGYFFYFSCTFFLLFVFLVWVFLFLPTTIVLTFDVRFRCLSSYCVRQLPRLILSDTNPGWELRAAHQVQWVYRCCVF